MRLIYTLFAVLIFASCSKKDAVVSGNPNASVDATQIINATINTDFTYELPLTSPDIKIHKQASHFSLSTIGIDSKNGNKIYQYLPEKGFTGTDEVMLKDTRTYLNYMDGGGCNNMSNAQNVTKTSYIKIKFSIAAN